MPFSNVPPASFINLFKEIIYDKSQNPNYSLDIWDAVVIGQFRKNELRYFQMHKVSIGDTWVGLARKYYGDDRLWWIIPLFNDLGDPFFGLDNELENSGISQLQVLKPEYINQLLLLARQQKIINDRQKDQQIDRFEGE
jgi:hypothetical protein